MIRGRNPRYHLVLGTEVMALVLAAVSLAPLASAAQPRRTFEIATDMDVARCSVVGGPGAYRLACSGSEWFRDRGPENCIPKVVGDLTPEPGAEVLADCGGVGWLLIAASSQVLWAGPNPTCCQPTAAGAEPRMFDLVKDEDAAVAEFVVEEWFTGCEGEDGGSSLSIWKWRESEGALVRIFRVDTSATTVSFELAFPGAIVTRAAARGARRRESRWVWALERFAFQEAPAAGRVSR